MLMYLHPWSWGHIHEYIQVHGGQNRILEGWCAGVGIYLGGGGGGGAKGARAPPSVSRMNTRMGVVTKKFARERLSNDT